VLLTPPLSANSIYCASTETSPEATLTRAGQSLVDVALV
jgi:hypothetical protein